MTLDDRIALTIGRLIIQLEQKSAQLDDLMAKMAELEKENAALKVEGGITT